MPEYTQLSFEEALTELEVLVDTLDQCEMPLDESLMRFGNGLITARAAHGIAAQTLPLITTSITTNDTNQSLVNSNE